MGTLLNPFFHASHTLPITAEVRGDATVHGQWKEEVQLIGANHAAVRFRLSHLTEPGRLVRISLHRSGGRTRNPSHFWALVCTVKQITGRSVKTPHFEVVAASVSRECPFGAQHDYASRYQVVEPQHNDKPGFIIQPLPLPTEVPTRVRREEDRRESLRLPVTLSLVNDRGVTLTSEHTFTENLSRRGASVFVETIDAERGSFVRLTPADGAFSIYGVIRRYRRGEDFKVRLQMEFVGARWEQSSLNPRSSSAAARPGCFRLDLSTIRLQS